MTPDLDPEGHGIRPAEVTDAVALAALHLDVWDEAYADLMPRSALDARRATPVEERVANWRARIGQTPTWVAEDADGLIGFLSAGPGRDGSGTLEVMALYVRARVYGRGVGHALMRRGIGDHSAYLWVLDGNTRAIAFYERQGFHFDGQTQVDDGDLERRMVR
ncbi:hypothetical protein ASG90_10380 [Nocardioides sp. Soil797]|nr:hypothetical protein ASG90_10380 [Nocardioides sp. Soil797]